MDAAKTRRETIRWKILHALNDACPTGAFEILILAAVQNEFRDALQNAFTDIGMDEFRRNCAYLQKRGLITIEAVPGDGLFYALTPDGLAIAGYTAPAGRGVIRPARQLRRKTDPH